jgi:hypothetical protein
MDGTHGAANEIAEIAQPRSFAYQAHFVSRVTDSIHNFHVDIP